MERRGTKTRRAARVGEWVTIFATGALALSGLLGGVAELVAALRS